MFKKTTAILLATILTLIVATSSANATSLSWVKLVDGIEFAAYSFNDDTNVVRQEIYLLKINPKKITTDIAIASDIGLPYRTDIKSMAKHTKASVAINASFFDTEGKPLGLLIQNGKQLNKLHAGGRTLSGIFYIKNDSPGISFRETPLPADVSLAVQSGPRLIVDGEKSKLAPSNRSTRRSGIAITYDKQIIVYATLLRFPGATLEQVQNMLMLKDLRIKDALNLDGGSSSQLYINENIAAGGGEVLMTGGDMVPVGLVFKTRK